MINRILWLALILPLLAVADPKPANPDVGEVWKQNSGRSQVWNGVGWTDLPIRTDVRGAATAVDSELVTEKAVADRIDLISTSTYLHPPSTTVAGLPTIPTDASPTKVYRALLSDDDGVNRKGWWFTDGGAWALGVPLSGDLLAGSLPDFTDAVENIKPKSWAAETIDRRALERMRFIEVTTDNTQLEVGQLYTTRGASMIMPPNPVKGDWLGIYQDNTIHPVSRALVTGGTFQVAGSGLILSAIEAVSGYLYIAHFDGTNWTGPIPGGEIVQELYSSNSGDPIRGGISYVFSANNAGSVLKLPPVPLGVIRLHLSSSTGDGAGVTIEQDDTSSAGQILNEAGEIVKTIDFPYAERGETVYFLGALSPAGLSESKWRVLRPWVLGATRAVIWHASAADKAVISRLNIYPAGTVLNDVTAPDHIRGGEYKLRTVDDAGALIDDERLYLSNGISGAGGAWKLAEKSEVSILDSISIPIRSAGTNAGSNVTFSIDDDEGNTYPSEDWVYSGVFTRHSGVGPDIEYDRKTTTSPLVLSHNREGVAKLHYVGDKPNGHSAITVTGSAGGNINGPITVEYEGTNRTNIYANQAAVDPMDWTTIRNVGASDQAATLAQSTEYVEKTIFSWIDPEETGTPWFNWRVKDGETVLATEFVNGTDAEFIAIKPKLDRFGIGTAPGFDNATPYAVGITVPNGGIILYTGTDQEQGLWEATADVTVADANIGNEPFLFRGKLPTQDRSRVLPNGSTVSMDVFDMQTNQTSIRFTVRNGESATFLKASSPSIVEIINEGGVSLLDNGVAGVSSEIVVTGPAEVEFQRNSTQFNWIVKNLSGNGAALSPYIEPVTAATATAQSPVTGQLLLDYNSVQVIHDGMNADFGGNGDLFMPDPPTNDNGDAIDSPEIFVEMRGDNQVNWTIEDSYGVPIQKLDGSGLVTAIQLPAGTTWAFRMNGDDQAWNYRQVLTSAGYELVTEVAANEIGSLKMVPNVKEDGTPKVDSDYAAAGFFVLKNGYRLVNGVASNPKFSAMFPAFVDGADLRTPTSIDGAFVRNLGGNAAAFMAAQADATAPNSLRLRTSSNAGGNSFNATHSMFTNTGNTSTQGTVQLQGDAETRPANFAMQFVLVLDSYAKRLMVEPDLVEVEDGRVEIPVGDATINSTAWSLTDLGFNPTTEQGGRLVLESDIGEIEIELPMLAGKPYWSGLIQSNNSWQIRATSQSGNNIGVAASFDSSGGGVTTLRRIWHYKAQKSVINPTDAVVDTTQVGTPLQAGSDRHYVMQWDGTKLVNTLAMETWTEGTFGASGYRKYMVDHLTNHARINGRNVITSSGTIDWSLDFASASTYVFAHDLREAQAETASMRINSRTLNTLNYTLHDSVGTGDGGSNVQFELSGEL